MHQFCAILSCTFLGATVDVLLKNVRNVSAMGVGPVYSRHLLATQCFTTLLKPSDVLQEDVRNIEAGKIPLPKYLASAEPIIPSNAVSTFDKVNACRT
jgi:hypothetical protein